MTKPDFLKYLTPKAIVNLSVIVGFLIFMIPTLLSLGGEVRQRAAAIREQRVQIDRQTHMIAKLAEFREASSEVEAAMADLQLIIPPRERLFSFPQNVERLAAGVGATADVNFVGRESPATESEAGSNIFTVTSKGNFDDTLKLISALEKRREFFVSLDSINMTRLEGQFNTVINGLVFFYD